MLEEQAKQQQQNAHRAQEEIRQQQILQTAELARQQTAARAGARDVGEILKRQSTAADATKVMIAQLRQEQVDQQARTAAMAATSEDLTTQVAALTTLLKGQSAALADMGVTVASLQTTVGNINTNVADLSAKMDQLLTMGVGCRRQQERLRHGRWQRRLRCQQRRACR